MKASKNNNFSDSYRTHGKRNDIFLINYRYFIIFNKFLFQSPAVKIKQNTSDLILLAGHVVFIKDIIINLQNLKLIW